MIESKHKCPECGDNIHRVEDSVIYGRTYYKKLYACRSFPKCDTYGMYPMSIAHEELRLYRRMCHKIFDQIWMNGYRSRTSCYKWMAKALKIEERHAHIGLFRTEQCLQLLDLMKTFTK